MSKDFGVQNKLYYILKEYLNKDAGVSVKTVAKRMYTVAGPLQVRWVRKMMYPMKRRFQREDVALLGDYAGTRKAIVAFRLFANGRFDDFTAETKDRIVASNEARRADVFRRNASFAADLKTQMVAGLPAAAVLSIAAGNVVSDKERDDSKNKLVGSVIFVPRPMFEKE